MKVPLALLSLLATLVSAAPATPAENDKALTDALEKQLTAGVECTGDFCACETGYCWQHKMDASSGTAHFSAYRFCQQPSDCLKGCVDGRCHVLGVEDKPFATDLTCSTNADCFVHRDTVHTKGKGKSTSTSKRSLPSGKGPIAGLFIRPPSMSKPDEKAESW
ncbi:hypothetical protein BC831DRAFT_467674 [Entophlyctis helioformis]|nr:hypothetical protein BC831DRAFT_467674 [Entophlyctis helioformis]